MALPLITLVGRPNVGKSSLLNKIARRRVSIVEPTPGITRDRVSVQVEHDGRALEVMDTGGMGLFDETMLKEAVEHQIGHALLETDLVVFMVDASEGIMPLDQEVARRLRKAGKPVLLVANKAEKKQARDEAPAFVSLGFGQPRCISALSGQGVHELMKDITRDLPVEGKERSLIDPLMKIAVVGKRNAGKSSLINHLAGEERVIVSEIPGTTRDSVDVLLEMDGRRVLAIDTAGLRRRSSLQHAVEFFSMKRAEGAVRRAQIVLYMFDLSMPISRVDKGLIQFLTKHHKPVIIVGSKWDLAEEKTGPGDWEEYIRKSLPGLAFAPISFMSVMDGGFHVTETMDLCWDLFEQSQSRVTTGQLNRVIEDAVRAKSPKAKKGNRAPKIYYATQVAVLPPTVVLFVNNKKLFTKSYERYLQNRFREFLPYPEVPVRILFRDKEEVGEGGGFGRKTSDT